MIYLLGHNLILPLGSSDSNWIQINSEQSFFKTINLFSGGNISMISIFSLGISPWMSTLILWQLLSSFEKLSIHKLSQKNIYKIQIFITIIISLLQGTALLYIQFESLTQQLPNIYVLGSLFILVTGSIFVVWLGNLNEQYGLGGSMLIIIIGMILNAVHTIINLHWEKILIYKNIPYLFLVVIVIYFYIWQMIAMTQAEYQIPIRRILIQHEYKQETYLPIPLLPSGGMQFMYSMMLFSLLSSFIQLLHHHFYKISLLNYIYYHLSLTKNIGIIFYLLIIGLLCFSFSNLNFNTEEISKELQKSGDYILNIMPGDQTKHYLDKILFNITLIEITYSWLMTGLPFVISLFYPKFVNYSLSITMLFILISLSLKIIQEIRFIMQYDTNPSIIEYIKNTRY